MIETRVRGDEADVTGCPAFSWVHDRIPQSGLSMVAWATSDKWGTGANNQASADCTAELWNTDMYNCEGYRVGE